MRFYAAAVGAWLATAAFEAQAAPLLEAVQRGDLAAARELLAAGASATTANRYGVAPLMLASRTNGLAAVELLIAHGANVNVVERWQGQTPLTSAAEDPPSRFVAPLSSLPGSGRFARVGHGYDLRFQCDGHRRARTLAR